MTSSIKKLASYVGVGAALLVPAIVIAQQTTQPPADGTFAQNAALRARDLEQLRDALAEAIGRIDRLPASGNPLSKSRFRAPQQGTPVSAASQAIITVNASCPNGDILMNCNCLGVDTQAFLVINVQARNPANAASTCTCTLFNSAVDTATRMARAEADCYTP